MQCFSVYRLILSMTTSTATAAETAAETAARVEEILLERMENINPYPQTREESEALNNFLELSRRYIRAIEPSELFTRRAMAFLDTIQFQRERQLQEQQHAPPPPRVQVTRMGSKRVFADITHQVMQDENISAGLLQNNHRN